jgi:Spy/CpxP family protein refolding chaperone
MKRTILMITALVLTASIYAQRPGKPMHGQGGKGKMEQRMGGKENPMKDLNLTDAQQNQMKELNGQFREKMKALRENESITVKSQRDQIYILTQQHRADVQKILTPQQREQMKASREANMVKMQERQGRQFDKKAAQLKLTEAQKTQLKQQQEKNRAEMQALRSNDALDRTAKQQKVKSLMEKHNREMEKVLSKEQMEQWKQMKNEAPRNGRHGHGKKQGPVV